ncbi:CAP domain-containing protein [Duganella callida]|uniref:CAP domain-containing protein n=1 Tax=Duganella callida TaxID=2561932 RepID=A0A4Y9SH13_9BURK|nr:CAP domain-containing protein [Duganella callida]TFW23850.1 CAP domain-containing protein [Duganella callida]
MKRCILLPALLLASAPAQASPQGDADQLTSLINAYRAAPGPCDGSPDAAPAPPLTPQARLAGIRIQPGTILIAVLDRAGYASAQADAISVTGAASAQMAMQTIQQPYCRALLSTAYTEIGVTHIGQEWSVVLARPAPPHPPSPLGMSPDRPATPIANWQEAGQTILEGVNAARANARVCGGQSFAPAPPLRWNPALGAAALAHSQDMARQRYFSHTDKEGKVVGDRARQAGYQWLRIGENIASGQLSPQEALAGWLTSPGHCANIMNPDYTEMGAAYDLGQGQRSSIYWTQVFGKPRK